MDITARSSVPLAALAVTAGLIWHAAGDPTRRVKPETGERIRIAKPSRPVLPDAAAIARSPFESQPIEEQPAAVTADWRLQGVVVSPGLRVALLNGQSVKVGDTHQGFAVQAIEPGRVTLVRGDESVTIDVAPAEVGPMSEEPEVAAVVVAGAQRLAVVEGQTLREGDDWRGLKVRSVGRDGVLFSASGRAFEVKLRDGSAPPPQPQS